MASYSIAALQPHDEIVSVIAESYGYEPQMSASMGMPLPWTHVYLVFEMLDFAQYEF